MFQNCFFLVMLNQHAYVLSPGLEPADEADGRANGRISGPAATGQPGDEVGARLGQAEDKSRSR